MSDQEQGVEAFAQSGNSPPGSATHLPASTPTRVTPPPKRLKLWTADETLKGPDPEGIPVSSLTLLYGPSGHGGSFVAISSDWRRRLKRDHLSLTREDV
jgi:hypothetical protein